MEAKYAIGTKYTSGNGKAARECVVTDIYKTYNSAGELVKIRYATSHVFMGQKVTDHDVIETTIARALFKAAA